MNVNSSTNKTIVPNINIDIITDIIIIGGGPIGIFTVFQAGMLGLKTQLIDCLSELGGQCAALYKEKFIYDIPGYPKITAEELILKLTEQAKKFSDTGKNYHLNQTVISLKKEKEFFLIETDKNLKIKCKAVVIAAGAGAFDYNKIPLPGLTEFENHSLFYSINSKNIFYQKNIAIAGGGDSAIDWAITLSDIAKKIYLIHRRDKFRCMPNSLIEINKLVNENKIELITPYQIKDIKGVGKQISEIILTSFTEPEKTLSVDYLLAFFGLKSQLKHIESFGLKLHNHHIIVDKTNYSTNISGVYAIGDIASYPGKLKLILSGFAESATVCHDILQNLYSDKPYNFQYSTNMEIF